MFADVTISLHSNQVPATTTISMKSDELIDYNRSAWDHQVEIGNQWTLPANSQQIEAARNGNCQIVLTPTRHVPASWLDGLTGKNVLCLAGGGGQQAPLLAAAGANVTTFDNSQRQLQRDEEVAKRENLQIKTVLGDMQNLSQFENETFDLIVNPCSNSFAPDVQQIWKEAYRVLKIGGELLAGFTNPLFYIFDYDEMEDNERLVVRHKIPYSDITSLDENERNELMAQNEPLIFGHSLEQQLGGQLSAGFAIVDFFEDNDPQYAISKFIDVFIATRAKKLS